MRKIVVSLIAAAGFAALPLHAEPTASTPAETPAPSPSPTATPSPTPTPTHAH